MQSFFLERVHPMTQYTSAKRICASCRAELEGQESCQARTCRPTEPPPRRVQEQVANTPRTITCYNCGDIQSWSKKVHFCGECGAGLTLSPSAEHVLTLQGFVRVSELPRSPGRTSETSAVITPPPPSPTGVSGVRPTQHLPELIYTEREGETGTE